MSRISMKLSVCRYCGLPFYKMYVRRNFIFHSKRDVYYRRSYYWANLVWVVRRSGKLKKSALSQNTGANFSFK